MDIGDLRKSFTSQHFCFPAFLLLVHHERLFIEMLSLHIFCSTGRSEVRFRHRAALLEEVGVYNVQLTEVVQSIKRKSTNPNFTPWTHLCLERAIARHEVREIEQRHTQDGLRERDSAAALLSNSEDDMVIIYNRVPKTASTSFTNIAYDLCGKNHYHVLHINTTKNNPVMSIQDQVRAKASLTSLTQLPHFNLQCTGLSS